MDLHSIDETAVIVDSPDTGEPRTETAEVAANEIIELTQEAVRHLVGTTVVVRRAHTSHPFGTGEQVQITQVDAGRPDAIHVQSQVWRQWLRPNQLRHLPGYTPPKPAPKIVPKVPISSPYTVIDLTRDQKIWSIQSPDGSQTFTMGQEVQIAPNTLSHFLPQETVTIVEIDVGREDCIKVRGKHFIDWIKPGDIQTSAALLDVLNQPGPGLDLAEVPDLRIVS